MAVSFRIRSLKSFKVFPLCSEAVRCSSSQLFARSHQPSERDHFLFLEDLDLYWTTPESGATVVQINGLDKDDLFLFGLLLRSLRRMSSAREVSRPSFIFFSLFSRFFNVLRILVYLVIYDAGSVSLEHLLLLR